MVEIYFLPEIWFLLTLCTFINYIFTYWNSTLIYLLYELEQIVGPAQLVEYFVNAEDRQDVSVGLGLFHYIPPGLVDHHEAAALFQHLCHYVR